LTNLPEINQSASAVVVGDKIFYMGGFNWISQRNSNLMTTNGSQWITLGTLPGNRDTGGATYFNNALWYIGGFDGSLPTNTIWTSNTGNI
jgi:hypothetical protein